MVLDGQAPTHRYTLVGIKHNIKYWGGGGDSPPFFEFLIDLIIILSRILFISKNSKVLVLKKLAKIHFLQVAPVECKAIIFIKN